MVKHIQTIMISPWRFTERAAPVRGASGSGGGGVDMAMSLRGLHDELRDS